jgi:hypothetical protein
LGAWARFLGPLLTLAAAPCTAEQLEFGSLGIGALVGPNLPIAQDDAENGWAMGLRGRVGLLPIFAIEPSVTWLRNGDTKTPSGINVPAPNATIFGLSGVLRSNGEILQPYLTLGIGWTTLDLPESFEDESPFTAMAGFGVEFEIGVISVDLAPRLWVIGTDRASNRNNIGLLVGINYALR